MDKVWILAECRNGAPIAPVLEIATAARRFGSTLEAIAFNGDAAAVATTLGEYGVTTCFDFGDLGQSLPGPKVASGIDALIKAKGAPDALLIAATYDGRDVAARLSVKIDRPLITNVVGLSESDGTLVSEHAIFGGTEIAKARFTGSSPQIFVIRAKSFAAEPSGGAPASIESVPSVDAGATDGARVADRHVAQSEGPSLDDARIVVSGGRGLGSAENYQLVERLAELLRGAPGASRAIVDAGWVSYAHQVGQTGKTVKPDVYIACGISGATQHLVGMKNSNRIVAINKDEQAPIFSVADLGVVGDVTNVLPRLIKMLEARS